MRKRSKHEPTESYFYAARYLAKCMMRLNLYVGPVRTQTTNTQTMNIPEINTQQIPTLGFSSLEYSESKTINLYKTLWRVYSTNESESRSIIFNAYSTDKIE